jgi:hypothetical protein
MNAGIQRLPMRSPADGPAVPTAGDDAFEMPTKSTPNALILSMIASGIVLALMSLWLAQHVSAEPEHQTTRDQQHRRCSH